MEDVVVAIRRTKPGSCRCTEDPNDEQQAQPELAVSSLRESRQFEQQDVQGLSEGSAGG